MNAKKRLSATVCVFLTLFLVTSGSKIFTLFFTEFEKNGIPMAVVSAASIVVTATIFLTGLSIGKVIQKIGIRGTMVLGCVLMALAFVMFAVSTVPTLFLGFLCLGGGTTYCGYTPASLIISNWYGAKKGLALSAVFTGMSLGASFYSYAAGLLLAKWGLWGTGLCVGVFILVAGLPILLIFLREAPEAGPETSAPASTGKMPRGPVLEIPAAQARKTRIFWLIMAVVLLSSGVVSTIQSYIPSHLQAEGLSALQASRVYSLMMLVGTLGTLLGGFLSDQKGTRFFILYTSAAFFIGAWLLVLSPRSMPALYAAAALMGLAYPLCSMTPSLLLSDTFCREAYTGLLGIAQASTFASIGFFFPLTGILYQASGSYRLPYVLLNLLMLLNMALTLAATSRRRRAREQEKLEAACRARS